MNIEIAVVGAIVGAFVGLSGMGGGAILTPLLVLLFGINPLLAVGTDLFSSAPMKIVGAIAHRRQGTMDGRVVLWLALGGVPGALLGLAGLEHIRALVPITELNLVVSRAVGVALVISAAALLFGSFARVEPTQERAIEWSAKRGSLIALLGFCVGALVSITSIGSGSVTLPLLFATIPYVGVRRLIGSDIAFAAVLIPIAALGHVTMGNVNFPFALSLMCGSIPGVLIGSKLCALISPRYIRPVLAGAMVMVATRFL